MKKLTVFTLVLLLFVLPFIPVWGDELEDLREQQEEMAEQIKKHQQEIAGKDKELKSLTEQMTSLDRTIEAVEKDLAALEAELLAAAERVEQVLTELADARARLENRTEVFKKRVVGIYQRGDVNYLEVLMDSTSMTDFLVRMELLQKIAEHDLRLLEQIEAEKALIEAKKAQLEEERDKIEDAKASTELKKERLAEQQLEKSRLSEALKTEKALIERALAEEEEASKKLGEKIREIQARMASDRKFSGEKMLWPTPGYTRITDDYGPRWHPVLKKNSTHTGIDIGAPMGAKIVAADYGQVTFVGYFGAYGNAVMVEHGSGITTLYGHLSAFTVKEGAEVLRGEQIGKVGSTGISTGPHLHFEVRKNGNPVSPWNYLK
ncbi:MAG: peptidoglycan DD-metalloendopeptidase family protein [Bacillota bacterium]